MSRYCSELLSRQHKSFSITHCQPTNQSVNCNQTQVYPDTCRPLAATGARYWTASMTNATAAKAARIRPTVPSGCSQQLVRRHHSRHRLFLPRHRHHHCRRCLAFGGQHAQEEGRDEWHGPFKDVMPSQVSAPAVDQRPFGFGVFTEDNWRRTAGRRPALNVPTRQRGLLDCQRHRRPTPPAVSPAGCCSLITLLAGHLFSCSHPAVAASGAEKRWSPLATRASEMLQRRSSYTVICSRGSSSLGPEPKRSTCPSESSTRISNPR